jgi:Undecaprenyl-phosphate glucose phosphotransferase
VFKRHAQFFVFLRVLLDVAIVAVAFDGAWHIRFGSPRTFPYSEIPLLSDTLTVGAMALVLWPLSLRAVGLYKAQRQRTALDEVLAVLEATLLAGAALVVITYFTRENRYSRGMLLIFTGLSFVGVGLVRFVFKHALMWLRSQGFNRRYVLVLGAGRLAHQLIEAIEAHRELGFHPVGVLSVTPKRPGTEVGGVPVIGTLRDLQRTLDQRAIDQVLVALPSRSAHQLPRVMNVLSKTPVDVKLVPDVYQYATLFGGLEEFGGLPIVNLQSSGVLGINAVSKRLFDLLFASLFLLVAAPFLGLFALLVKATSTGTVFYSQERVGLDGKPFQMIKLRSMRVDAELQGAAFAQKGDRRATSLGRFLRRTSLDELPQLVNVVRGDMSLVGPRPERPVFIQSFRRRIPRYQLRHMVKAGMTGWAQVHGLRGQTSIEKRVEYDLYYIQHWSLLLDVRILARTLAGGFLSKNAF